MTYQMSQSTGLDLVLLSNSYGYMVGMGLGLGKAVKFLVVFEMRTLDTLELCRNFIRICPIRNLFRHADKHFKRFGGESQQG